MYAAELERCTRKINRLIRKGSLKNKNVYLFGVSDNTRQIIKILRKNGYEPTGVADNDINKCGSYCSEVKVFQVEQVEFCSEDVWLLYSFYWREMRLQLIEAGVHSKQIFPLVQKEKTIWETLVGCMQGKHLYQKLLKKYGNVTVFLCPYTGTGDIYLIGTFWNEYIEQDGIEDYVFVVISGACKKVATLFEIKNIVLLDKQKDAGNLISYYNLCPDKMNLKILNDAWAQINDNSSEWFRGYKGWYFTELFRKWVFDLPDDVKPKHPVLKNEDKEVSKIFNDNGLEKGNTIILSPYSNTLSDLPLTFWEQLCALLKEKGYCVCTNSCGPSEPPIYGSTGVFFPLNVAPQFVNFAGGFIGVRSGLCDIISNCIAQKVILYDLHSRFYNCSAYEYFGLKKMGLSDDVIEIQFEKDDLHSVLENIGMFFER